MKKYEKPSVQVIELQINEDIAAIPTTVYKGIGPSSSGTSGKVFHMALTQSNAGLTS